MGAFYALALIAGTEARGLPGARLERIRFQGADCGFALDDIILEGIGPDGRCLLEIQSKRDVTFAPKDDTFEDVARQVALSRQDHILEECHHLAVASQRTSRAISGAYQDVLLWARGAENGSDFFARLDAAGVANDQMRQFTTTFRNHLVAYGVSDDDEAIWRRLRRFQILEFDFESTSPLSRTHALMLARLILAHEDVPRAEGLWSALIELAISVGRTGGALDRDALRTELQRRGFRLSGDRDHRAARAVLRETARQTLENIGTTVAGVHLPRHAAIEATGEALDASRFVLLTGGPGVGKSGVLRAIAERAGRESTLLVLDADTTPVGGWIAFAGRFGIEGPAKSFLADIAASGGGLICIDGIDMITDPAQQRTINEVLREAGRIDGFRLIASARADSETQATDWLADDLRTTFGPPRTVTVDDLTDVEAEALTAAAPHLRPILTAGAPAAPIARNLHRLSRLSRLDNAARIRTEAGLAKHWWDRADDAPVPAVRAGQRILAALAKSALAGERDVELAEDGQARAHLLGRRTLREVRRDRFDFQHDVLRDWAIGAWLSEDLKRISEINLTRPPSPRVQRGVEFAARFLLEGRQGVESWTDLLKQLEKPEAIGGWRRSALLAIVRSEAAPQLLELATPILLADECALLGELIIAIQALETVAAREVIGPHVPFEVPQSLRIGRGGRGLSVLRWACRHQEEIPLASIAPIVDLVGTEALFFHAIPSFAHPVAAMLFDWLLQLDLRDRSVTVPMKPNTASQNGRGRRFFIEDLRTAALLLAQHAPDEAKTYLREVTQEGDPFKTREILKSSSALAPVAPEELASLVKTNLRRPEHDRKYGSDPLAEAFSHADADFLPASPAQPPFLDLLTAAPAVGLPLVHHLVETAVAFATEGEEPSSENGFTIVFDEGPRFFPWRYTYLWSRDQSRSYAVGSALKALEAWGHERLDAGDAVENVLRDVLGSSGSCAAFLLVAVDLLLSHWPRTRDALMPFLTDPALLAVERGRGGHEQFGLGRFLQDHNEPKGRITLADLAKRPSRRATLESALYGYVADDHVGRTLRKRLADAVARIGPYSENANFGDAAFMGPHALNVLTAENWVELGDGRIGYRAPPEEAAHVARMEEQNTAARVEMDLDARIRLALNGGDHATPQTARDAVIRAAGALPNGTNNDVLHDLRTQLATTALLVARDGDDALLAEHESWVRTVVDRTLDIAKAERAMSHETLNYNRPAIAILAMIHLWRRAGKVEDRDALVSLASRHKDDARLAFAAGREAIVTLDRRVLKAAMRAALSGCIWRWRPFGEDDAIQAIFEQNRAAAVARVRIPEHPVGHSDDIRSAVPKYPVTAR
ncbi:ATP-binding protein, partial [Rhodovulum strictum]|uniref:ATP-binding protein n=2 Tax=Rhodovulum strictum TaxID=58314 RepID=UPI001479117B